jgi:hypothetical protein
MTRMLKPEHLPPCLWSADLQLLQLPDALAQAFEAVVDAKGIRGLLQQVGEKGPVGGRGEEDTLSHFVNRFDGSSARLQLAFLDPHDHLAETSNVILSRLSGGITCFVDAPCGTGAGFLSLLLITARLRELDVLPRVRLEVRLVAADVSESARAIANDLLGSVRERLEDQAIFVEAEWIFWDVSSEQSTVSLNKEAIRKSDGCRANLLLVANFSGHLIGNKQLKVADPQLYELFKYFSGDDSFAVWIEPNTKDATAAHGLLSWLSRQASSKWSWFAKLGKGLNDAASAFKSEAKFKPILRTGVAMTRVSVSHMRLLTDD